MTVRIFISYSHDDFKAKGRTLYNYLSKHVEDSVVYIDQKNPEGTEYEDANLKNLNESDILIVVVTPAAKNSVEVENEVKQAKELNKIIIPCKDDRLDITWNEMPFGLASPLGIGFDNLEDLMVDVYRAIKRAREPIESKEIPAVAKAFPSTESTVHASIPILYSNTVKHLDFDILNGDFAFIDSKLNDNTASLDLILQCLQPGEFSIVLPRNIIDAKLPNGQDDTFFVLINGEEVTFNEEKTQENRKLTIFVSDNVLTDISIIGTQLFGVSYTGEVKSENIVKILPDVGINQDTKHFDPEILRIKAGEKVRWENQDAAPHTISSGTIKEPHGIFDSGLIIAKKTFEVTFKDKGNFSYYCLVHPWASGKIIVE